MYPDNLSKYTVTVLHFPRAWIYELTSHSVDRRTGRAAVCLRLSTPVQAPQRCPAMQTLTGLVISINQRTSARRSMKDGDAATNGVLLRRLRNEVLVITPHLRSAIT
jgi:hypothetical protein